MNIPELEKKTDKLFHVFPDRKQAVDLYRDCLSRMQAEDCFRIQPVQLGEKLGISTSLMLDMLLYSVKYDILRMEWHLVCEACTGLIHSNEKFSVYGENEILCPFCNRYVMPDFRENVEVTFSVHPSLDVRMPDFCKNSTLYKKYFFSKSYTNGGFEKYMKHGIIPWYHGIAPESNVTVEVEVWEGLFCHLFSLDCQTLYLVRGTSTPNDGQKSEAPKTSFIFLHENNDPVYVDLPTGKHTFILSNQLSRTIGVSMLLCVAGERFHEIHQTYPVTPMPLLSGSRLLTDSRFIELFGRHEFTDNFFFQMGNLSILFSDLQASTQMYGEIGDLAAYNLVGKHFDLLSQVVEKYRGRVIKTIGDAVMAVFYNKIDAVIAAIEMHETMESFRHPVTQRQIKLKIGIHHGTVLAISANQSIDYFGQTVNIAARVQSLACGGEICMPEMIIDQDVARLFSERKQKRRRVRSVLKGIREKTAVHHYKIL